MYYREWKSGNGYRWVFRNRHLGARNTETLP